MDRQARFIYRTSLVLLLLFALFAAVRAHATPITYTANDAIGFNPNYGPGNLTGTITTDGTIGPLKISNIQSWNLLFTLGDLSASFVSGTSFVTDIPIAPSCNPCSSAPLSATATQLIFDFSECGSLFSPCFLAFENFADVSFVYFAASITGIPNDGIIVGAVELTPQSIATSNVFPLNSPLVIAAVPEPGTALFFGLGLLGLLFRRWIRTQDRTGGNLDLSIACTGTFIIFCERH